MALNKAVAIISRDIYSIKVIQEDKSPRWKQLDDKVARKLGMYAQVLSSVIKEQEKKKETKKKNLQSESTEDLQKKLEELEKQGK